MSGPLSSRTLVNCSRALLIANVLLAVMPTGRSFIPSDLAINLGIAYGVVCAACHLYVTGLARDRLASLSEEQRNSLRKPLDRGRVILAALGHIWIGTAGFGEGVGSLYTLSMGRQSNVTYVVADVEWTRYARCYKHEFLDASYAQRMFGGPCLDLGYLPDSRFNYLGRLSMLGFKHEHLEVESNGSPRRRASRD